ncbi:RNA polymerase sigma factor RpoD/SigA [Cyanobium sp. Morenito 9A2]|uniref:sigma-70 family RNA polymerase sigma factor n=1 Tax=Cyanobium sp. Morenito 9A2 TaxID=2823718 RepID=UPI0020CD466B|nr:sigma-70 family RNA polymerase sigma factor [Cyanobium sp. Morenito 9A2]MCP9848579.1 sigma-70 family RNA polymerase sigma factor [Cyanobium sp. Morenito 9A2]
MSSDTFGDYLHTIGRIPLLTPAEELHLGAIVQRWQQASDDCRDLERRGRRAMARMVTANLRLVVAVVKRHQRRMAHLHQEPMDLVQAGNIGLLRAVEKFDPCRGYKFSTYAYWWIRQAVSRYLQEQGTTIRLPVNVIDLASRAESMLAGSDRTISSSELAKRLGETEARLQFALHASRRSRTVSLDQQTGGDGEMTLLDLVPDPRQLEPHDDYRWMLDHLRQLEEREVTVLELRYGHEQPQSFAKVAQLTGYTKDQVQRIERHALGKLRLQLTPVLHPA